MVVITTSDTPVPRVRNRAEHEHPGWSIVAVRGTSRRRSTLAAFAESLAFPGYFGHNLDALLDCLRDVPGPVCIIWQDAGRLRRGDRPGYAGIIEVLDQLSAERTDVAAYVIG